MFSTILKEFSGFFDKRSLTSAFFPAMVFWGITISLMLLWTRGWARTLQAWEGLTLTGQVLLLMCFFGVVTVWSFLTLNFQSYLFRLYEGYWPFEYLADLRRKHWQRRWDSFDQRDNALRKQDTSLYEETTDFDRLLKELDLNPAIKKPPADIQLIGGRLDSDLSALKQALTLLEEEIDYAESSKTTWLRLSNPKHKDSQAPRKTSKAMTSVEICQQLTELGPKVRACWETYLPYREFATSAADDPWTRRRAKLDDLTGRLGEIVKKRWAEVGENRLSLNHEFFLMFSPNRSEAMATELGNVLKAAQTRVRLRYHLDTLLVWSRLQPLLPKEVAEPVQDAKTSVDLMITLSTGLLLFGLPLSVWMALQSSTWFSWWVSLILLAVGLFARLALAALPAASALVLAWVLPVQNADWQAFLSRAEVVLIALAGLWFLSWICYQNAVQSCLAYGERIQSAYDLYRWKVLEELHLQLPPNLKEERRTWEELGQLLYRGSDPSSEYYRYVKDDKKTKETIPPPVSVSRLPVPASQLPAFHPITNADIIESDLPDKDLPIDVVRSKGALADKLPLIALPANQPVSAAVLKSKADLSDHVAVGIEIQAGDLLGGKLAPGNLIDIIITSSVAPANKYANVLVLDVSSGDPANWLPPTVVIALPRSQLEEFLVERNSGNLSLSRPILT